MEFLMIPEAKAKENVDIADEKLEEITITSGGSNFELTDLYDGLMLTEKGNKLLSEAKDAIAAAKSRKFLLQKSCKSYRFKHNF